MYKAASDKRQSALHRGGLRDWMSDPGTQSPAEERANLQAAVAQINLKFREGVSAEERAILVNRKKEIDDKLREMRHNLRATRSSNFTQQFVDIAREILPNWQYEMIIKKTLQRVAESANELAKENSKTG